MYDKVKAMSSHPLKNTEYDMGQVDNIYLLLYTQAIQQFSIYRFCA